MFTCFRPDPIIHFESLMSSSRSRHVQCRKRVSIITNLLLRINRYKRENDKEKSHKDFLLFLFLKV